MEDNMIRKCGSGWAYCNGECNVCMEPNIIATNRTYDHCMVNNINGYVYIVDNTDRLKEHKASAERIAEAIERTKKYIKE